MGKDRAIGNIYCARIGRFKTRNGSQECCFSRAASADDDEKITRIHFEAEFSDGCYRAFGDCKFFMELTD